MEYKFFDSKNHDRTYSAADWADYFASFVGNGVFANPASSCQVVSSEGRTVEVSPGKLWINGYMGSVTAPEAITLSASDADNPRIDRIAARLDLTHREVALAVLTGEPSSEPQAAELTRTDEIYEICLAEIWLGVGVTEITQADITDTRADSNICGWVTGLIDQIDATGLFAQYQSTFERWFDNLQNQLDDNQAANLQKQIYELEKQIDELKETVEEGTALNDRSWEDISNIAATGLAANYFAVGDRKAVTVSGTVGTQSVSGTYYVYILGFNHNSSTGIDFGTFMTAASGGADVCLIDSMYTSSSTDGTKYFNMNHSSNTNSGGWKGCDLRYDVLGSTNADGADAGTTTATSPVSGTLMAALPSDLRAVMKPMTIYTNNTGGGSDTASYVTASVDYLPLLAEFEIFGTRTHANSAEQNYQAQYEYYSVGNSKVKYEHSATSSAAHWWERSPYYSNSGNFCYASAGGTANNRGASTSYGLAPAFRV